MSEIAILAAFFAVVMAGVVAAGYLVFERAEKAAAGSILIEPGLAGAQSFFAQAFRRVGESVPAKADENPMRTLLMKAGYRAPSAVPILQGVKYAATVLLGVVLAIGGALSKGDIGAILIGGV